jgi:hypothetical protein
MKGALWYDECVFVHHFTEKRMTVSIFDPMTKMALQMLQMVVDKQLDGLIAKHSADRKAVDALNATKAAVDGAITSLVSLSK